nr:CrtX [uncultured bacterium]
MKKKILLFSEGVTLSQVVRLVTLGRSLDPARYDVTFACSEFDELAFGGTSFRRRLVHSLDPKAVHRALRQGRRLYDRKTLLAQVEEDLAVFDEVRPDVVVGDFRWSLAVSAPVHGVPHAALINAYWSPYATTRTFPVPDHPIVRLLGEAMTAKYFPVALPRVFEHFAAPLNEVRKVHGLPPVGSLLEVLTHGDHVLYADPPELVPTTSAPANHEHLGYVPWAPGGPLPGFWNDLPADRPVVYATVGSSGDVDTLPLVVEALGGLPVTALVATAGRKTLPRLPANVYAADFLPGDLAARRSALVISNGGSSTSYQALAEGVPVLGLASNLDQYLAMAAIEASGAGQLARARLATAPSLRATR